MLAIATAASTALLTGCSGSVDGSSGAAPTSSQGDLSAAPTHSSAPQVAGPGTYQFEYAGAVGKVEVPTDKSDPRLAKIEAYRHETRAHEVQYIVADIDNTAGTEDINMYQVVVVTEDGQQIEATDTEMIVGEWQDRLGEDDTRGYNRGIHLINSLQTFIRPGAKGSAVLITSAPVNSVSRVYIYPSGGAEQVEAFKPS